MGPSMYWIVVLLMALKLRLIGLVEVFYLYKLHCCEGFQSLLVFQLCSLCIWKVDSADVSPWLVVLILISGKHGS